MSEMIRYVSLLRGINVSGQKQIKMVELVKAYEELGFKNVQTYIQSGNVVFETNDSGDLDKVIGQKIFEKWKFEVPVLVLKKEQIQKIVNWNPFLLEDGIELDKLHVTFLSGAPGSEHLEAIESNNYGNDRYIVLDTTVYLYCPNGYGRTRLTNTFFENKLKVSATTRNWKTVNILVGLMNS